jgi:biotin operon repressor
LLQARRDWPGRLLAQRLEISDRTLRRDIQQLRDLGYRIDAIKGPDGGYRLDAGAVLPPLHFDDAQAVALAVALQVAAASGATASDDALRALHTVRQVMPSRLRHRVDGLRFTTALGKGPTTAAPPETLVAISAAARSSEVLPFDYARVGSTSEDEPARRRVEPHHVVFAEGRWYLVAWDLDAGDWRVFRIDRMTPRASTGPRFEPRTVPGGDAAQYLAGRLRGSELGGGWPCVGQVVLEMPASDVLPFVDEGTVEALAHARCRLTIGSWSWVALAASIARFDAPISDVSPLALVEACTRLSGRLGAVQGADLGE